MKKGLIMFYTLTFMLFALPSFATDTTLFYMPLAADITTKDCDGFACGDIVIDENTGIFGVKHGLFTAKQTKTFDATGDDRKHYSAGVHFDYELADGFTPYIGAALYSGFDGDEHRIQILNDKYTLLANIGFEAPITRNIGMRMETIPNVITTAGFYFKF